MPYTAPTVNYSPSSGPPNWQTLTGVQSVSISRGRQRFQDPIAQTNATIELIPATSYSTPLAIGQNIDVRDTNADNSPCYFYGRITDIQRSYDMPYNSGTGYAPGDRITISAAGATGVLGTASTTGYGIGSYISSNIAGICSSQFIDVFYKTPEVLAFSQTISGPLLDIINQLLRTAQWSLDDCIGPRANYALTVFYYPTGTQYNSISFTDTGSGYAYTNLEFLSSVQNTLNWVNVTSTGVGSYLTNTGLPPYNSLQYNTYSNTTADVQSLSGYLLNLLSGQTTAAPFSIRTNTMAAPTCTALAQLMKGTGPSVTDIDTSNAVIGQPVSVTFRGSTSAATVIGVNTVFYPDHASVQLYLSPSLGTPFTLDSTSFGVLDQNRLGYP